MISRHISLLFFLTCSITSFNTNHAKVLKWNWSKIDCSKIAFPNGFLWGASTSSQQVEGGCDNNNWSLWERSEHVTTKAGNACNYWNKHQEYAILAQKAGLNSLRISIEWSKVEPQPGKFNVKALEHYRDVCKSLLAHGIKPVVTFHHYTEPIWFCDTDFEHGTGHCGLGGFTKKSNIKYFVRYCKKVYEYLHPYVHLWITFNNPTSYASKAYYKQSFPPAKKDMQLWQEVLVNMLEAHVQTYFALKTMPNGMKSNIGIMHNVFLLDKHKSKNPFKQIKTYFGKHFGNRLMRDCVYQFFTTGIYDIHILGKTKVKHRNKLAPHSLDFIGLSYYSHGYVKGTEIVRYPGEPIVDNHMYTSYPEGMYRAITEVSKNLAKPLNIPIYVTENGVSTSSDSIRSEFYEKHIYAISQAIKAGHDVRGYLIWSLMDNYSWGTYDRKYGIYEVDFATQKRTLRPSAQPFLDAARRFSS